MYTDKQLREVFHLSFLSHLVRIVDPRLIAVKGGCNLRFFFQSPRYSEDLDIDVFGGSVETLKKNGYKILESLAFKRGLATFGIQDLLVGDKSRAKHTQTTQRFRLRLLTEAGEEFPTKIEFSRRRSDSDQTIEKSAIGSEIVREYRLRGFECPHYTGREAVLQKIQALSGRSEVQARDIFDLYLLHVSGYVDRELITSLSPSLLSSARENAELLDYEYYRGQVVEYLVSNERSAFSTREKWKEIHQIILQLLDLSARERS